MDDSLLGRTKLTAAPAWVKRQEASMRTLFVALLVAASMAALCQYGPAIDLPPSDGSIVTETKRMLGHEINGDRDKAHERAVYITNVVREVHTDVTEANLIPVLKEMGYWGPASAWAQVQVTDALKKGIMVGRTPGTTPSSDDWRKPATREELAATAMDVIGYHEKRLQDALATHDSNPAAHPWLLAKIMQESIWGKIAFWSLLALLVLGLILLIIWLWRRGNNGGGGAIYRPGVAPRGATPGTPIVPANSMYGGPWGNGLAQ